MKTTPLCRPVLGLLPMLLAASLLAQESPLRSGPAKGTVPGAVKVYAPLGPFQGKEFDASQKLGKAPGAILFVHEVTRETAPVIRALDNLTAEFGLFGFRSMVVLLEGDRTSGEEKAKRFSKALRMRNPMVVSLDGAEGPGSFALNRSCTLTIVMCKAGKVAQSIALKDTGQKDVGVLRTAIEQVAGKLPKGEREFTDRLSDDPEMLKKLVFGLYQELKRLQQQMNQQRDRRRNNRGRNRRNPRAGERGGRQGGGMRGQGEGRGATSRPVRRGRAPDDDKLRGLLRSVIQKDNTSADLDEIFVSIEKRIGDDKGLRKQAVEMFKLVDSLGYGTDEARKRARAYVLKHGGL